MSNEMTDEQIKALFLQMHEASDSWLQFARAIIKVDRAFRPDAWISVADRLPGRWDEVIVWPFPGDYCMTGQFEGSGWTYGEYDRNGAQNVPMRAPTHWMPLPTAPAMRPPAAHAGPGSPDTA